MKKYWCSAYYKWVIIQNQIIILEIKSTSILKKVDLKKVSDVVSKEVVKSTKLNKLNMKVNRE